MNSQLNGFKKFLVLGMSFFLALILLLNSIVVVDAGHTGVVLTMGKEEENVLTEGFHFKLPFVQRVVEIDNRIVKLEVQTEAFS